MDITQKLYWLMHAGITCFCGETPTYAATKEKSVFSTTETTPATQQATTVAMHADSLDALNAEKQNFQLSSLKKTATHTILGAGIQRPKLMCVLDMPDGDSDRTGNPLAGSQATQIQKMMSAIHLDMQTDVYITYLSPWRTPGNRSLTDAEIALFLPFLTQEIHLVQPQNLFLLGTAPAQALLKIATLSKARGKWHSWENIPTRVSLPISMLKTTPLRRQAWADLQEVEKNLSAT